jgi:glycosyltransferase involved in cell wall biosynthesis
MPAQGKDGTVQLPVMANPNMIAVVPAFNEVETVGEAVRRIHAMGYGAVVVDDGSVDGTAIAAGYAGAPVLSMPINVGVGAAMRTGFRYAVAHGFKRVVPVVCVLPPQPEGHPTQVGKADEGVELVIGSRFAEGYETGGPRRWTMRALAWAVSRSVGVDLDDVTSGFRIVSEPLLSHFAQEFPSEYLADTVEAILQAHAYGASIAQVSIPMDQRVAGDATSTFMAGGHLGRMAIAMIARKPQGMGR